MASYWDTILTSRISRRRALAATGATTAGAALLAACGGGGDGGGDSGGTKDSSGLVTTPVDATKGVKKGGTLKISGGEPLHFDGGIQGQGQLNIYNSFAYSSLVQNKPGIKQNSTFTEVVPDLAESWEISPDKLSVTFKLRQGVKWHNIAPVNGRLFDSADVVANWTRYEAKGGNKAANSNKTNPNAPIVSVTAPDSKTVVYKLNQPTSFFLERLGTMITGEAGTQLPKETDNGFDPRTGQIGTGGFIFDKFTPSVSIVHKRNPDYFFKDTLANVDQIDSLIIPAYANALAQFKAGAIHHYIVNPIDMVTLKKETPGIGLYQTLAAGNNPGPMVGFGWQPPAGADKSPFLDIRVRRALAMSYDRDAFIDAFNNVSRFEADGLPVDTYYYTAMGYIPGVTLDPRDTKTFGPNAQYYTQNQVEAKKLIAAAYPNGMPEVDSKFNTIGFFGADHQQQVETLDGWAKEVGFKVKTRGIDYNLEYLPKYVTAQGKMDGWVYRWGATTSVDPVDYYVWRYWSKSGATSGALGFGGPEGSLGNQTGDATVDSLIEKAMQEVDNKKRVELIGDLQRHLGGMQYGVTRPGFASGFTMAWPAVENFGVFWDDSRGSGIAAASSPYTWWLNQEKPPFKTT